MSDIIKFYAKDAAKNPDAVLEQAIGEYENVFLIGWNKDDELDCRSDTNLTTEEILWMIEKFKFKLMRGDYSE